MQPSLAGQLTDFDLPQLLMMLETSQASGALEISGAGTEGSLYFEQGRMVCAAAGAAAGKLAAYEILSWDRGEFCFNKGAAAPEHNVDRSNQRLCLEAMRLLDESRNGHAAVVPTGGAEPAELSPAGRRVLAAVGEAGTASSVAGACGFSRVAACYYLEELEELGAVTRVDADSVEIPRPAAAGDERIRMLVVDDSALMQKVLMRTYESAADIEVVGTAANGREALEMLPRLKPDVISLDLYMPVMDGVTTLKRIMLTQPTPTVVITSANPEDLDLTFELILRFGALDFITKPSKNRGPLDEQTKNIVARVRKAARVNLRGIRMLQPPPQPCRQAVPGRCRGAVVAQGGTGGCLSYMQLLTNLPIDLPFAVIGLLDFPEEFLRGLVGYLKKCASFDVELAAEGAPIRSGVCYLAAAASPPRIDDGGGEPRLRAGGAGGAAGSQPLFLDAARIFKDRAVGLLLSGDGAEALTGLAAIRAAGGITLAQLPDSCVDPEQPERAIDQGIVDRVVVLPHISNDLSQVVMNRLRRTIDQP